MDTVRLDNLFLIRWVKATFMGWLMGFGLLVIFLFVGDFLFGGVQFTVGLALGAGVGFMQWRILKKYVDMGPGWMWASALGMTAGFLGFEFGPAIWQPESYASFQVGPAVLVGAAISGLWQAAKLRPFAPRPMRWVLASVIAWAFTSATARMTELIGFMPPPPNLAMAYLNLFLILISGLVLGIVSGWLLRWTFRG